MFVCMLVFMFVCMWPCVFSVCMFVFMFVCMLVFMCAYTGQKAARLGLQLLEKHAVLGDLKRYASYKYVYPENNDEKHAILGGLKRYEKNRHLRGDTRHLHSDLDTTPHTHKRYI